MVESCDVMREEVMRDESSTEVGCEKEGVTSEGDERYKFKAEIAQLMSLIINTFYSNKEIFLRELISNCSDALDKVRYESLKEEGGKATIGEVGELEITIEVDAEGKKLIVADTGIGMRKLELVKCLGTIAHSGTRKFMEAMQSGADVSLIGQFGVGFYSAFLVAHEVEVVSKHAYDEQYVWKSSASGEFTVRQENRFANLQRGTVIILHMKDDQMEYCSESKVKEIVKKHSQYINYPIKLKVQKEVEEDVVVEKKEEEEEKKEETNEEGVKEEKVEDSSKKIEKRKVKKEVEECLNPHKPLWRRAPETITKEEYATFYKSFTNDWQEHLAVKHFSVEGSIEMTGLFFVPQSAPFDLFETRKKRTNFKLHVRQIYISDNCDELAPEYLNFVKGIVDSNDLPLNISRETLQQNKIIKLMRKHIIKKCLEMFDEISKNEQQYKKFYENFSKNIKLGIHEDAANRDKLIRLLRYPTSATDSNQLSSLEQYVARMPANQTSIYFITGDSKEQVSASPFVEKLISKNIEVIYMCEPIDEYCVQQIKEFDGKKLVCVTKENVSIALTEEEQTAFENAKSQQAHILPIIQEVLGSNIEKVIFTNRLQATPACLSTSEYGWTPYFERIMKAQTLRDTTMASYMTGKKILELNPFHPIIQNLSSRLSADSSDLMAKETISLLYQVTLLASGFSLENPTTFSNTLYRIISRGIGVESLPDSSTPQSDESSSSSSSSTTSTPQSDSQQQTELEQVD